MPEMSAKKILNTLFTYDLVGWDIYLAYDGTSGILRTLSKSDGSLVDSQQLKHGMLFEDFELMCKEMYLDLTTENAIPGKDLDSNFSNN